MLTQLILRTTLQIRCVITTFTDEEIDYFLDTALYFQKEKQDEDRQENIINLEDEINNAINNSYSTENLSYDDIGKVLVKIAANYFED